MRALRSCAGPLFEEAPMRRTSANRTSPGPKNHEKNRIFGYLWALFGDRYTKIYIDLFWAQITRRIDFWIFGFAFLGPLHKNLHPLHKNLHRPLFWASKIHVKNRIFGYLGSLFGTAAQMGLDADWIGSHPEHHEPKGAPKFSAPIPISGSHLSGASSWR